MHTPTLPTGQPAIGPALHRAWGSMKARLFQPFQIGLWLALGLSAWLSEIHQSLSSLINAPLQFLDLEQHFSDIHTWIASLPILWVGTGIFLAIVLIVALVAGFYFMTQMSGSEAAKNNAIAEAADNVGNAAQSVGDAASEAGKAVENAADKVAN